MIAIYRSHTFTFGSCLNGRGLTSAATGFLIADGEGIAPTRACAPLRFQDRGITALPTILKIKRGIRNAERGTESPRVNPPNRFHAPRSCSAFEMALAEGVSPSSSVSEAPRSDN